MPRRRSARRSRARWRRAGAAAKSWSSTTARPMARCDCSRFRAQRARRYRAEPGSSRRRAIVPSRRPTENGSSFSMPTICCCRDAVSASVQGAGDRCRCRRLRLAGSRRGWIRSGQGPVRSVDVEALAADPEVACATRFWAPPAALMYRRSLVDKIGGFRPDLPVIQDARFLFDAASHGAGFARSPHVGAFYRVRPQSLSRRDPARFWRDVLLNGTQIEALWRRAAASPPTGARCSPTSTMAPRTGCFGRAIRRSAMRSPRCAHRGCRSAADIGC